MTMQSRCMTTASALLPTRSPTREGTPPRSAPFLMCSSTDVNAFLAPACVFLSALQARSLLCCPLNLSAACLMQMPQAQIAEGPMKERVGSSLCRC